MARHHGLNSGKNRESEFGLVSHILGPWLPKYKNLKEYTDALEQKERLVPASMLHVACSTLKHRVLWPESRISSIQVRVCPYIGRAVSRHSISTQGEPKMQRIIVRIVLTALLLLGALTHRRFVTPSLALQAK